MYALIAVPDALVDLCNIMPEEDVVERVLDGIRDASPDRPAVKQYLSAIDFQWPASAPKRRAQRKDYWDLIIDPERLKPAILERLKAASIEESVKNQITADACDALMKAVIKEVPRREFALKQA